jgi:hypothetical protein
MTEPNTGGTFIAICIVSFPCNDETCMVCSFIQCIDGESDSAGSNIGDTHSEAHNAIPPRVEVCNQEAFLIPELRLDFETFSW